MRTKFLSRFLVVGVFPVVAVLIMSMVVLYVARRSDIADLERTLLAQKQNEIEQFLEETISGFEISVSYEQNAMIDFGYRPDPSGRYQSYLPEFDGQKFILEGALAANKELVEVSLINTLPFDPLYIPPPKIGAEMRRASRLADIPSDCIPPYTSSGLLPCDFLLDYSHTELFRAASAGKDYIGPVYWTLEGPMVSLATPVHNKKGTVIAVLRGELKLTKAQQILSSAILGNAGYVFLVDGAGNVLARSRGPFDHREAVGEIPIVRDTLAGTARSGLEPHDIYRTRLGTTVIGSSRYLSKLGWGIIAEWPYEDAFASLYAVINQILIVGLLMGGAVVIFALVVTQEVIRPIRSIARGAERIGKGEFAHTIHVATRDELEGLAATINTMARDLAQLEKLREVEIRAAALARALEKERELSRAKDVFITTASHQLRTPISAINWNAELLQEAEMSQDTKELVQAIAAHSNFLAVISNDLLNASTFGLGYTIAARPQPVDLCALIDEALGMFETEKEAKHLTVRKDCGVTPAIVPGSAGALRTLLENLIANAITYSKEGGEISIVLQPSLALTASRGGPKDAAGGELELTIQDKGIGIPAEEQQHIFSAFFRASNAIESKNVGTGLGLFIVKNIVDGHGGTIRIESERNKGTKVIVTLPRTEAPNP